MRIVRDFIIAAAVMFLVAAIVFQVVDPRGDFRTGVFPVIVRDTRVEKMGLFSAYRADGAVQGLILGSSRSMKLAPRVLTARTGLRFFNFAVDNARAEDDLGIERWVRQHGARPRFLIVGLDVEALHNDDAADDGFLRNRELQRALTGQTDHFQLFWTFKRAFTPTYVTDTADSVRQFLRPTVSSRFLLEPDGYLRDLNLEAQRAAGTFDLNRQISPCLDIYVSRFQGMTGLSPRRKEYVEQLIAEERAEGGRTIVWLTPLHPITVRRLEARTKYDQLLGQTRAYLDELRTSQQITSFDFSEPDRYGGTLTEWDDCAHTNETDSERIAAALTRQIR